MLAEQTLYFLVIATGASFVWLLATGYQPRGEHPVTGALHLAGILAATCLISLLLQRQPWLTLGLTLAFGAVTAVLWLILRDWNTRGHAFLAAFGAVQVLFVLRIAWAILFEGLGFVASFLSLTLFTAEVIAVTLTMYFAYEVLDVMTRLRWRRYFPPFTGPNDYWPKVSIHVPAHAEPPDLVIKTLTALRDLDYPNYEVIMVDDNTADDSLWWPVLEFCYRVGFKVFHLQDYPGFKSGALNFALRQTAPDAEIIAVVDSDYVVERKWLRETVPYFRNPRLAFLQTPQAFRNEQDNLFAFRSALAQRFFFEIGMRSRNESNAIIFCGTMGLVRKRALERIGGWSEWCITEDAEASLRLLNRGYEGAFINQTYGRGVLPTTFMDTKKQRFRWAFGGVQILRHYWRELVLGSRGEGGLTLAQRLIYLVGFLSWFNDLLILFFSIFLLLTGAAYALHVSLPVRHLAEWILLVPVLSIVTGVLRVGWALRRTTGSDWRHGIGAFGTMLGLSFTVAQACLIGLIRDRAPFLRTPKFAVQSSLTRALQSATWETVLGIGLAAAVPIVLSAGPGREALLLAALLGWHAAIYLAALRSSLVEAVPVAPHGQAVNRGPARAFAGTRRV
jgi:cellulose synthase/poly-beta-1,6-N-acetylglucosamine synthase-like glycosyltransferase